mmetsp:Transcript_20193/g.28765  ORF Transcript_20193/g.28765 Transcript_20193/m.28765 type:complete len:570 (+) Transcript_20193:86-1795(+)
MPALAGLDMYRKVPAELLEGTRRGSVLSIISLLIMTTLVVLETKSYLTATSVTDIKLDSYASNKKDQANSSQVTFNITFMDLKCDFIAVDQVSVFGTDQNVRNTITKRTIDGEGTRKFYNSFSVAGRKDKASSSQLELYDQTVTETLEELHKNGVDAVTLTPEAFDKALQENKFVFVDFYASWCSHCRDLLPTWETLGELMNKASVEVVKKRLMKNHEELEKMLKEKHGSGDALPEDWTDEHLKHAESGLKLPVLIAKLDCVEHAAFCFEHQMILAYPTLRLFVQGEVFGGDYYGHRTVLDFTDYLATIEEHYMEENGGILADAHEISKSLHKERVMKKNLGYIDETGTSFDYYGYEITSDTEPTRPSGFYSDKIMDEWIEKDHPGCEVSGYLLLDRAPGNFHIFARSEEHDLVPQMTNLSHHVIELSFEDFYEGTVMTRKRSADGLPLHLKQKVNALDGATFTTLNLHEAYHHYIKLVSTNFETGSSSKKNGRVYQMVVKSQIAYYQSKVIPIAKFQYDYSPVSVTHRVKSRKWYDYMTSLLAIVGGMFTVIGMLEGSLNAMTKKKRF